jgi:hypothetical protein
LELLFDHNCHERWEWKQETGTNVPGNAVAARRWLDDHPTGKGRASMLLRVSRLVEADAAIAAIEPDTPEEAFGVEILRKTREQIARERPTFRHCMPRGVRCPTHANGGTNASASRSSMP